jgi:hypothetical protein
VQNIQNVVDDLALFIFLRTADVARLGQILP